MNSGISRILALSVGIFIAMIVVVNILSSGANVIGEMFKYLLPVFFLMGVILPRQALYAVFLCGAYLDVVKRLLTLETNFGTLDIALVMGLPLTTMAGICASVVVPWLLARRKPQRREIIALLAAIVAGVVLGGSYYTMGGGGLRGLGASADASVYFFMFLIVPFYFKTAEELAGFFKTILIMYIPAAAWAIYQWRFGIFDFEMNYLLSGATIEARQLNERVFRNMGSMVAANALSVVASISFAALAIPLDFRRLDIRISRYITPIRIIGMPILLFGAYATFSRTGWVCGIVAMSVFIILRFRMIAYSSFLVVILSIVAIYASSTYIYENGVMNEWQDILMDNYGTSEEAKQAMVLGTLNDRFESMSNFITKSDLWTPLGLKASGAEAVANQYRIHDVLTEALVQIGYIPLVLILVGVAIGYLSFLKINFTWETSPERNLARYFLALGIGIMASGLSAGKIAFIFPINAWWCFFFSAAIACRIIYLERLKLERAEQKQASLEISNSLNAIANQ